MSGGFSHPPERSSVDRNRELLGRARRLTYKVVDGTELDAYAFLPEPFSPEDEKRSCIAFFFGSGWDNGVVSQFAPQCVYFAARGMVALAIEYRVASKHGTTPYEAMADARSAMRWLRMNAAPLGIDPEKIVAGGASGGAHIALAAAMIDGFDEPDEDADQDAAPNAFVLYSPVVDVSPGGFGADRFPDRRAAKQVSPLHFVRKGLPPAILFHGKSDRVVPPKGVRKFAKKMGRAKNGCELVEFDGQGHGFFNFNVDFRAYEATISAADQFLVEHGFLKANPDDDGSLRLE